MEKWINPILRTGLVTIFRSLFNEELLTKNILSFLTS